MLFWPIKLNELLDTVRRTYEKKRILPVTFIDSSILRWGINIKLQHPLTYCSTSTVVSYPSEPSCISRLTMFRDPARTEACPQWFYHYTTRRNIFWSIFLLRAEHTLNVPPTLSHSQTDERSRAVCDAGSALAYLFPWFPCKLRNTGRCSWEMKSASQHI